MERNKKTTLLFLLLSLLFTRTLVKASKCKEQDKILTDLPCNTDYNKTVTCSWHSPYEHDPECTIHGKKDDGKFRFSSSCILKPVDASRPALKKCSMVFPKGDEMFSQSQTLTIELTCNHVEKNPVTSINFKPICQIKLDPPQKPKINDTTVILSLVKRRIRITKYDFNLQWKQEDESWKDAEQKRQNIEKPCEWNCAVSLRDKLFIQGEKYEARVRVKAVNQGFSVWSEWSHSESWVSHIGTIKTPSDGSGVYSAVVICCVMLALALLLIVISLKRNKTIWIFLITKIKGQPIPDPALSSLKDVNFQNYLSPQLKSFFKPLEIASIEIASSVDDISPIKLAAEMPEKMRSESSYGSSNSSFSNPSYAHVCSALPSPVSLLTSAGNLDPCSPETPYGPVCCQSEDKEAGQKREEVREKEVKIRELFSKDCNKGERVPVISDYEKVEKLQMERSRLQSLDSGVGSGEEVSQESLEADSITTESNDENQEERELEKGKGGIFQKLFGGSVDIFGKGSIQVCSDYERVQKLQPDSPDSPDCPELRSLNANEIQEQTGHQESLEDTNKSTESTSLLAPPCSFSSITSMSSNSTGPALKPVSQCNILALMKSSKSMELSGDGYLPVRQEQS